ncbi:hypothetical protein VF21_02778 [Pseudogymnoascus sp. 05NY08]|nr:hypothetical protein VF21_02778 [Pseudogymnoascus sp. 05NY08]
MEQRFKLTAPRARGELKVGFTLDTMMFYATIDGFVVPHFVIPIAPAQQASPPRVVINRPQNPQDTFCTLPLDIHELIFSYLDNLADLTCVGLMSPYLWGVTQDIIYRHYRKHFGCFAGENIVFAGSGIAPGDYPSALFPAEEVEVLDKRFFVLDNYYSHGYFHKPDPNDRPPLTLYNMRTTTGLEREMYSPLSWLSAVHRKSEEIMVKDSLFVPTDQAWILRNLSTKEFVTSTRVALDAKFIHGPCIRGIGFGEVIALRTCWSSGDYIRKCFGQIHKGVWAGHRFDITTRGHHDESTKGEKEEWKDVSDEVAEEIAAIWESEYGPSWREGFEITTRQRHDTDVAVEDYPAGLLSASEVAAILSGEKPEVWDDDSAWSRSRWDDWGGGTQPCHTLYALEGEGVWAMTEAQTVYNQCAMRCRTSGHRGSKKQVDAKLLDIYLHEWVRTCTKGPGVDSSEPDDQRHDEATMDEEWSDVSAEVASEISDIWECHYGPDWVDVCGFHQRFEQRRGNEDDYNVVQNFDVPDPEYYTKLANGTAD